MCCEKVIKPLLSVPFSYGFWSEEQDCVYMSDKMARSLGIKSNITDSYSFAKSVSCSFGGFLKTASEKVLIRGDYSESFGDYKVTLLYDRENGVYFFYILENARCKATNIQNSESNLENILNTIPIYVWQRDADLKIKYCNKKYADVLETSTANVIKSNLKLPITTEIKGASLEQIAMASGKMQKARRHVIVGGTRKLLEFTEFPINSKKLQMGYAVDVTEEETITKEYNIFKRQTHETFNHISVPIAIFDANTDLIFANNAMLKLFELDESYVSSFPNFTQILDHLMETRKLMEVDDYPQFKQKLLGYFRDIVEPYHTFTHIPNGRSLNIMISPNYGGGLIFVCEDITEKLIIEREYHSLSAVQKETLEHLYEGILVFGMDNRIRMTNQAARNIWKIPEETVNGLHVRDFFAQAQDAFNSRDDRENWISRVISMSERREEESGVLLFKSEVNVDYTYVPLPDGMNLIRFVDITDRVKLEKVLTEKAEITEQIDKLKSSFIANMSYELKAPINTISGFSEILLNQYFGELNEKQKEYCAGILSSINKLSEMIDVLLNLSSIEAGKNKMHYSNISISHLFNELIGMLESNIADKNINVTKFVDAVSDTIYIDESSIKQMLCQILSTVINITPIEGRIDLSAKESPHIPNYTDISIKHTSVGISPEQLEKIRQILAADKTVSNNIPSTTFDFLLLFANHVVKLHNGKIIIDSKQNEYTEFIFRIPAQSPIL